MFELRTSSDVRVVQDASALMSNGSVVRQLVNSSDVSAGQDASELTSFRLRHAKSFRVFSSVQSARPTQSHKLKQLDKTSDFNAVHHLSSLTLRMLRYLNVAEVSAVQDLSGIL